MANKASPRCSSTFVLLLLLMMTNFLVTFSLATPVNVPVGSVSDLLIQSALGSLNENSPTGSTYRSGNLIRAQKLLRPEYVIYKLSLNLEPNCDEGSSCPREACTIDLRQHEHGVIVLETDSIQCMYLYPHTDRTDAQQPTFQDGGQQQESGTSGQEPEATIESFERRTSNASLQLDHEVQTVSDVNERPFIAVRATDRNYCAGCPYELNPTLPGLAAYNEQVVQSMDDTGRSEFKHRVVSIVRVTRAVPPGSNVVLYELLLEIGKTNCLRVSISPRADCPLSSEAPIMLCLVTFEQRPWQQDSRKIVRNNCTDLPDTYNELTSESTGEPLLTSDSLYTSEKISADTMEPTRKDINEEAPIVGSVPCQRSPVTEETLKKVVVERPQLEEKKKIRVFEDKYKEFDEFLENIDFNAPIKSRERTPEEQPGTPVTEEIIRPKVAVRLSPFETPESGTERAKRSVPVEREIERTLARELAQLAVDELDYIDVDDRRRVLLDILDSKTLPGDDSLHYITMRVATTNCPEGTTECSDHSLDEVKVCRAQVQTRASGRPERVLQSQCFDEAFKRRDERTRRHLLGGQTSKSVDDPEIKGYADKGLRKYAETRENEPFLVKILEATAQVVSGMKYQIKVRLGESTCTKGQKDNCTLRKDQPVDDYLITVWSQPWKDQGNPHIEVVPLAEKRTRRSVGMPGGVTSIRTDDPKIREYAEKGLTKYVETFGGENEPYLVKIVESWQQVVSGMMYMIRVSIGESTCPKGTKTNCQLKANGSTKDYQITVWSQPWLDHGNPDIKIKLYTNIEEKSISKRSLRGQNYSQKMLQIAKELAEERASARSVNDHESLRKNPDNSDINVNSYSEYETKSISKRSLRGQNYSQKMLQIAKELAEERASARSVNDHERNYPREGLRENPDNADNNIKSYPEDKKKSISKRSLRGQNYSQKMLQIAKELADERAFVKYVNDYERTYESEEERNYRFEVFRKNLNRIEELRKNERGTAIYGATMFADLTPVEFRTRHLGLRPDLISENEIPLASAEIPDIELPTEFDWRHRNVVTEVKNQGSCGSCWAFSVTGNVESLNAIKNGKLLSLSEQELVDCDKLDSGCEGGLPDNAYRAIEQMGGLELETDYPYDGADEKCHFDKNKVRVAVVSGLNITSNETKMAQWLVQNGPISIGINANAMQFYMGGISHPYKFLCNGDNLDHGVLIVGYGIHSYPIFKKKMPYWIIKNSWGPRWGEQGYYRVYRGDGTCGLNRMATSAVIA